MAEMLQHSEPDFCDCLLHPFQHDPGVSQRQRVMEELLAGQPRIDPRKTADLLDYFYNLAAQFNHYDNNLNISDWRPFFEKSVPFVLATLVKYNAHACKESFDLYKLSFERRPSPAGLQLAQRFLYVNTVRRMYNWFKSIKGSELPVERAFENTIKDKVRPALVQFIGLNRIAASNFGIPAIDFRNFLENESWNIPAAGQLAKLVSDQEKSLDKSSSDSVLTDIYNRTVNLFPSFFEPIKVLGRAAEQSLEQSFIPLKEEFQKHHPPHLALMFAFLKLFAKLQDDLNGFTKKHLDFFYKSVLKINPVDAVPDKVHIVFEIQKELDKYLLAKGLLVKDGKDVNKQEILFALDEEIVVNKTQVKDVRTLYLNDQQIPDGAGDHVALLEGVYIAPDARKADGIDKDFQTDVKNYYTLGNKESRYLQPGTETYKPYPNARLGFILASPVLLLREGTRTVSISIECKVDEQLCNKLKDLAFPGARRCCDDLGEMVLGEKFKYLDYLGYKNLFPNFVTLLNELLNTSYYYVSEELVAAAVKKGLSGKIAATLRSYLTISNKVDDTTIPKQYCYCPVEHKIFDTIILAPEFESCENQIDTSLDVVKEFFKKRKPFSLMFSGEKEWISPSDEPETTFLITGYNAATDQFTLTIQTVLQPDKDAVTFYNGEALKEDFDTKDPLVKIELDDHFKIEYFLPTAVLEKSACCLDRPVPVKSLPVSLYHFFRNVQVLSGTKIDVQVCGLTHFIVQNDESVMDPNGPVYPFGSRPDIIDFDLVNPSKTYCINQAFIDDAIGLTISNATRTYLEGKIAATGKYKVGTSQKDLDDFINTIPAADQADIRLLLTADDKNYCGKNYVGPSFYIGSKEVFCKNWTEVFINLNWKDKPVDFNEYYLAYWADPTPPKPNTVQKYGLDEGRFEINLAVLQEGKWIKERLHPFVPSPPPPNPPYPAETTFLNIKTLDNNRKLFPSASSASFCVPPNAFGQTIHLVPGDFGSLSGKFHIDPKELPKYELSVANGFVKLNLQNQDFLHKDYAFTLARQMMALARYPQTMLEGAVYRDVANGTVIVFNNFGNLLVLLKGGITTAKGAAEDATDAAKDAFDDFSTDAGFMGTAPDPTTDSPPPAAPNLSTSISDANRFPLYDAIYKAYYQAFQSEGASTTVETTYKKIEDLFNLFNLFGTPDKLPPLNIPIPNEPWTPIIRNMSIDYEATATIADINLIHLYPYKDTYKHETLQLQPTLLASFCDEGTLFIGLEGLVPGSNLNVLFQLAEATADSELDEEDVHWAYLDNNVWKPLRKGFEVLNDATENLTTSGIVKFATPENMTATNTIMPKGLHWVKASIPKNSGGVSETTGIHAQAVLATFNNDPANDKLRLDKPIEANQISKLEIADASVKQVIQPYETFGGQVPEVQQLFYVRVSELLRHKGRSIQKFDYERMVLNAFPQIFKVKCINHSLGLNAHQYKNDFPIAPGYVLVAVIPDLNKLKAGNLFEPKAPVSLLEKITTYISKRISPFVRFRAMNPRYEKIHLCLTVKLILGKDESYYKDKLKKDLRQFFAPWAIGDYYSYKLTFGQCVDRSNIIGFLESLDYVDFILSLIMRHESEDGFATTESNAPARICPSTPRSILIAGDIDVCIDAETCEKWDTRKRCDHNPIKLIECKPDINS